MQCRECWRNYCPNISGVVPITQQLRRRCEVLSPPSVPSLQLFQEWTTPNFNSSRTWELKALDSSLASFRERCQGSMLRSWRHQLVHALIICQVPDRVNGLRQQGLPLFGAGDFRLFFEQIPGQNLVLCLIKLEVVGLVIWISVSHFGGRLYGPSSRVHIAVICRS